MDVRPMVDRCRCGAAYLQRVAVAACLMVFSGAYPVAAVDTPGRPVWIGAATDLSGSASDLEPMRVETLQPLITCVMEQGGFLALTAVRTRVEAGTLRLTIPSPTPPPVLPSLDGVPIFKKRLIIRAFEQARSVWMTGEAQRQAQAATTRRAFEGQARLLLDGRAADRRSDVAQVLSGLDRALREPGEAQRMLLVNSDLRHEGRGSVAPMGSTVDAGAWVSRRPVALSRPILPIGTVPFEGLTAAVQFLAGQCMSGSE